MIDIRTFFPVDFDVDKVPVHDPGYLFVFKTFVFHNMAPVACRVSDADKEGFVLFFGPEKDLRLP
jgi:hypothetical protein